MRSCRTGAAMGRLHVVLSAIALLTGCRSGGSEPRCAEGGALPEEELAVQAALLERWCPEGNLHRSEGTGADPSSEDKRPSHLALVREPFTFVSDVRPARPGDTHVVGTDIVQTYRAVTCDAVRSRDYDWERPTAGPELQRVTLYDIDVAAQHQTPERAHIVLLLVELRANTKAQAISFSARGCSSSWISAIAALSPTVS